MFNISNNTKRNKLRKGYFLSTFHTCFEFFRREEMLSSQKRSVLVEGLSKFLKKRQALK